MRALVVSHRALGLGLEDAIDSKLGQRKAGVNESLLDLLDRRPATSKPHKALVVEARLKHKVTGEARRLQVVTVANRALEHDRTAGFAAVSRWTCCRAAAHDRIGDLIRLALACVMRFADRQRSRLHGGPVITLLRHVRQLMGEQTLSGASCRHELPCPEYDIAADRVCPCVYRPSRFRGPAVRMDLYLTEIAAEARLHERARGRIER